MTNPDEKEVLPVNSTIDLQKKKWLPAFRRVPLALVVSLVTLGWVAESSRAQEDGRRTLRLMTYNIHHGEGVDGKLDLERIATIIRKNNCDLVALQEVDRKTARSKGVDQLAEIGKLTGMQAYFGKAIDYSGGEYGLGILSKLPVTVSKSLALPSGAKREQRIALEVFVKPEAAPGFVFVNTHLDSSAAENDRAAQNAELLKRFGSGPSQAILAGDFNSTSDKPELAPIVNKWVDVDSQRMAPTIPVSKPTRKIDYIFLQKDSPWNVESAAVLDEPIASDHLPLVATLRWKAEPK